MRRLTGIALELAGMSPTQREAFLRMFSWQSGLSMSMPRFMRSYDSVIVTMMSRSVAESGSSRKIFGYTNGLPHPSWSRFTGGSRACLRRGCMIESPRRLSW